LSNTRLITSTAYHLQTDGQTKRVNQWLEMYLRCCVHDNPKKSKCWLPLAEFWYSSLHYSSLGCTPFKALYGYDPQVIAAPMLPSTDNKPVQNPLSKRRLHTELIRQHLLKAQHCIKFQVGEKVLLKLQPYAQTSLVNRPYPKLSYKFFGPYTVLGRVGKAAYRLDLLPDSQIHPVFHVSQLKQFTDDFSPVSSEHPMLVDFSQLHLQPEAILE
jgi:hypothetical protein